MVKGTCVTNLDTYKREIWPTEFVEVPRAGEYVRSKRGIELKVRRVSHIGIGMIDYPDGCVNAEPLIEVGLKVT